MSQFGPQQNIQQGYSNTVSNAVPAFQQMLAMQRANPNIASQSALQGLINRPVPLGNQYRDLALQSRPVTEFSNYLGSTGAGNPAEIMQNIGTSGLTPYASQLPDYGSWKDRDIQRQNASGMLSKGLGALIPGLAMMAFPGAGFAKIATAAGMGGLTGGPAGALIGGLGSAVAPSISMPGGIGSLARAPIQAMGAVAKQFANPRVAARQLTSSGIGAFKRNG
jgi:hypothetical protein